MKLNISKEKIYNRLWMIKYTIGKNYKKITIAIGILVIAVSLPLAMKYVLNPIQYKKAPAANLAVDIFIKSADTGSSSVTIPPDATLKISANSPTNKIAFIRLSLFFDKNMINLKSEIDTSVAASSGMGRLVSKSTMAEANSTGTIVVVLAASPTDTPQLGTYNLATFTVGPANAASTNGAFTSIYFVETDTQVVDENAVIMEKNPNSVGININTNLPTSTPTPPTVTAAPTSYPTTSPIPSVRPTSTPTPRLTSTPTIRPTVTPTIPASTPTAGPTPTPVSIIIYPDDDTYVSGSNPTATADTLTTLLIDNSPIYYSYMKFDLSPLAGKTIVNATLKMYAKDPSQGTQNINFTQTSDWTGSTTNYNNRPAMGSWIASYVKNTTGAFEVDITTNEVKSKTGQILSLGFNSTNTTDGLDIYSKEYSTVSYRPQLVIKYY